MVNTLLIIMRKVSHLENYITVQHIELMNIVIMITGSIVGVAYITELVIAWYSGVEYEQYAFLNRATGPYWWAYWSMMTCNVFSPQFMWFKKLRTSIMFSFIISIVVNIGMWFERFVIIVTSLHRDYLPSSWTMFSPTFVDIGIYIGTIGFFFVLFHSPTSSPNQGFTGWTCYHRTAGPWPSPISCPVSHSDCPSPRAVGCSAVCPCASRYFQR